MILQLANAGLHFPSTDSRSGNCSNAHRAPHIRHPGTGHVPRYPPEEFLMNTPKQVLFRGEKIDVTEAREMLAELGAALSAADPDLSDFPAGKEIPAVMNPVWYTEMARAPFEGSMVSFRDPALGWRAFLIPWPHVATLVGAFAQQMALAAAGVRSDTTKH
jgi:hypothetical protein